MRVAIIGGGPSGLYLGLLLKKSGVDTVDVFEKNARDATFGFGVSLASKAMARFEEADKATHDALQDAMLEIKTHAVHHPEGTWPVVEPMQGGMELPVSGAITRLELLQILNRHAVSRSVNVRYETPISSLSQLDGYDLVVGADGANSWLRSQLNDAFGVSTRTLSNRFAWYGLGVPIEPGLSFKYADGGAYCGHYYPYTKTMSTFVAECDEAAWNRSGLSEMTLEEQMAHIEGLFAEETRGHSLINNNSIWRVFQPIHVENWVVDGRFTLVGDALYPAHFSIGSGTRLAMDDALALAKAITQSKDSIAKRLANYEEARRPSKRKLQDAAKKSFAWYEDMGEKMKLPPHKFAYDFMTRTGRMSDMQLMFVAPSLMKAVNDARESDSFDLDVAG